jgi:large subunit ribosomal protein L23
MSTSAYNTLVRPIITEDSTMLANLEEPQYVFQVAIDANKVQIIRAVESAFGVRVKGVNTLRAKGKPRRMRGFLGRRADTKKAFVTLEKGQSIDLF